MQPARRTPLASGTTPASLTSRASDRPRGGLSALGHRVAWAAAETILCDEDDTGALVPPGAGVCDRAVRGLDESLARSSSDLRRGFWVLSVLLEFLPFFVILTPRRMTSLPLARRLAYLEALENHRIGLLSMLLVAFKVPLCVPAFEEGEELRGTGFDRATLSTRRIMLAEGVRASQEEAA